MSGGMGRRRFLVAGALTSSGIGLQLAAFPTKANAQSAEPIEVDFCVVGAGYAGLTAALRLQQAGRSVGVLEARDRVGGRIWSALLSDGTPIDLGGQWVGPRQRRIHALAEEMKVPIFQSYTTGGTVYMTPAGKVIKDLPSRVEKQKDEAIRKLDAMASEVPLDTPWLAARAAEWDIRTIGGWMADNVSDPYARGLTSVEVLGSIGPVAPEQSLLWVLAAIRGAGGIAMMLRDAEAQAIEGGAQAVALRIAAHLGDSIHLESPVYRITQDATSVEVVSDEIKVRARRVIVTVPRTLADGIEFDPILPADAAQLIQRMPMGSVIKATLVYDEGFWRQDGLSGASVNPSSPVSATSDGGYEAGRDRPGLMVAFVGGESARVLGRMTPARRQDVIVGELVKLFGPKAAQLSQNIVYQPTGLPYIDHNWSEEEWTRGDYAAYLPPGVLTGYGAEIRKPFGRIHWAGTETATEWNIYMDGAVQSGERAAAEVLAAD